MALVGHVLFYFFILYIFFVCELKNNNKNNMLK